MGAVGAVLGLLTEQHSGSAAALTVSGGGRRRHAGRPEPGPARCTRATCVTPGPVQLPGPHRAPRTLRPPLPLALLCGHWCMLESRVHVARGPLSRGRQKVLSALTPQSSGPRLTLCGSSRHSPVGRCSSSEQAAAAGRGWLLAHPLLLARCCLSWPSQPQSLFLHCKICCFKKNNNKVQFVI